VKGPKPKITLNELLVPIALIIEVCGERIHNFDPHLDDSNRIGIRPKQSKRVQFFGSFSIQVSKSFT